MKNFTVLLLSLMLCGCIGVSQPSKFYQLQSINNSPVAKRKISVGIQDIQIPPYIDKAQIVTNKSNSPELVVSEFNRWAESLSFAVTRVVIDDMSSYLPYANIRQSSLSVESFTYSVAIEINKLGGVLGDTIGLDAWWTISKNGNVVFRGRTTLSEKISDSYDDLVTKESVLLNKMALQIVEKLISL